MGLLEAGAEARAARAHAGEADRDRLGQSRLRVGHSLEQACLARRWRTQERAQRVLAAIEERARRSGCERALELVGGRARREHEVASAELAAEPCGARLEVAERASKKSLIRFFSVRRSISSIFLIASAV
jgi:hypothetical protein